MISLGAEETKVGGGWGLLIEMHKTMKDTDGVVRGELLPIAEQRAEC